MTVKTLSWRNAARLLVAVITGVGASFTLSRFIRPTNFYPLTRADFTSYCELYVSGGELVGGGGGALSWRCIDHSDPAFRRTVGVVNLTRYCQAKYGNRFSANIEKIKSPNGWACATTKSRTNEHTVKVNVSSSAPAIGKRQSNGSIVPLVDSPNRYLDTGGFIDFRRPIDLQAYCATPVFDEGAPPLMYGIIAPTGERGFVRSDFSPLPYQTHGLPDCQAPDQRLQGSKPSSTTN